MKKIFKKALVCMLAFAMVLTMFVGTLVTSAASVTVSETKLTGSYKLFYNVYFTIEADADATDYGALVWRADKGEAAAVELEGLEANAVFSISGISLSGIKNVFNVKAYAVIDGEKVYAEAFQVSYADWLIDKKDGAKYNAEINKVLDVYYAMTGTPAYEGQATPELEAPADGNWEALLPFSVGEGEFGLGADGIQGNFADNKLRVNLEYPFENPAGVNLVTNGSFEITDTKNAGFGWKNQRFGLTFTDTKASDGSYSMITEVSDYSIVYQTVAVEKNTNYTLYVDTYADATNTQSWIECVATNESGYVDAPSSGEVIGNIAATNGVWKTHSKTFNSGDNAYMCVSIRSGKGNSAYMDNVKLIKVVDDGNVVANGSFEEGNGSGWTTKWMSAVTSQHSDGAKSIEFDCASAYTFQYVPVERNTNYTISYDYINTSTATTGANTWVSLDFCTADHAKYQAGTYIDGYTPQDGYGAYATEWTTMTYEMNSGENDFLCISVHSSKSVWASGVKKYYDNFKVIPEAQTGALVYKAGNEFDAADVSNADAKIVFADGDITAVDISNISLENAANQYTIVPFIKNGSTYTFGAVIKASYADVVAKALNSDDAALKATANAYNEMYKAVMGEYLCKVAE